MLKAILSTLSIMGWLGVILGILVIVNTVCGTVFNVSEKKESFSWKRLFSGLGKPLIFYIAAALVSVAFTMLPYINEMITNAFGTILLSNELLNTLSSIGVLGVVISAIVVQGKKAITNTVQLANMTNNTEVITWNVEEE
jgi:ABC-type molybdate transport system permease subunit